MKKCPNCGRELKSISLEGVRVDECENCHGVWFDKDELRRAKDSADEDLRWLDFDLFESQQHGTSKESNKICPRCQATLITRVYSNSKVQVDACPDTHGVWLDKDEFYKIITYLEKEVITKPATDYKKSVWQELKEVVTGDEGFTSELRDFLTVLRLYELRLGAEHSKVADFVKNTIQYWPIK